MGLDSRSLAAFRIAIAILLLVDFFLAAKNLTAFYSDEGVLPRYALLQQTRMSAGRWSLYMVSDARLYTATLIAISATAAVALGLGYRTRTATAICWVLVCSLQARNPLILHAGDTVIRVFLFWTLFLPLGKVWSLDARLVTERRAKPEALPSFVASWVVLLQLCFIYWFSAALKTDPAWHQDGTAVYYVLNLDVVTRPLGSTLARHLDLCRALTHITFWLEAFGPCLVFVPFCNGPARILAFTLFAAMHLGIAITTTLGLFSFTMIGAWLLVLPSGFWDWIEVRCADCSRVAHLLGARWITIPRERLHRLMTHFLLLHPVIDVPRNIRLWHGSPALVSGFVVICLSYVLLWNLRTVDRRTWRYWLPSTWNWVGYSLRLDQHWGMFAPRPPVRDGWPVLEARLADGTFTDLLRPDVPLNWSKPARVADVAADIKWRKLFGSLSKTGYSFGRGYLADHLCRRWNASHPPNRNVVSYKYWHMTEQTPPPGMPFPPLRRNLLWQNDHYGASASAPGVAGVE